MNFLAIIQDTWSMRFEANRTMLRLNGHTCLEEIISRLRQVEGIDGIVLITSDHTKDDILVEYTASLSIPVLRGDEHDVLSRTLLAVDQFNPEHIIKVSGAYPLVDPGNLSSMIDSVRKGQYDLATCECRGSIIRGLGAEIVRADVLRALTHEPLTQFQREFHTQFIKQNMNRFSILECRSDLSRTDYSLSLDIKQDYLLVKEVIQRLGSGCTEADIVALLDANPHLPEINRRIQAQEIGLDKLMLFPEKIRAISSIADNRSAMDESYPVSVELSLTDTCQLKCIWCSDKDLRERETATMTTASIFRLVDDLQANGTRGVVIEGGGEPTLLPDFDEVVSYIHKKGLGVGLITNGVRRLAPETVSRLEWVRVSLDAGSPQEYLELKGTECFERVIGNIQFMVQHCSVVGVGYVLTNRNYLNMENLIFLLQKINISYLHIRPVVDHPSLSLPKDMSYLQDFTYHQFPVLLGAIEENAPSGNDGTPCYAHSLSTVITSSGNVFICGRLNIHDWMAPMGNINESTFQEIWHGATRKKQASELLDAQFCTKHCPQCRMTKYNTLFAKQKQIKTRNFI